MALVDSAWYVDFGDGSTTGYFAVTKRPQNTAVAASVVRRQFTAPAAGSERCFVCIVAGTTANVTDATWTLTRGAKTTDGTATWQECTGIAGLNGDTTNTPLWSAATIKGQAITLGQVIQRVSGGSLQICTTAGTAGSGAEPAFSNTAGTTTADNTVTWTSLGAPSNFAVWSAPHARLENAFASTWGQAGNTFYVASSHAQTISTASTSVFCPGTPASPCFIYCTTKTHAPPVSADLTTGASITTTGAASAGINWRGSFYCEGINSTIGSGQSGQFFLALAGASGDNEYFKNCAFRVATTSASAQITMGTGSTANNVLVNWENCTLQFGATGQSIDTNGCVLNWKKTANALVLGSVPTGLFTQSGQNLATNGGIVNITGVDLGNFSGTLVNYTGAKAPFQLNISDCKIHASMTLANAAPNNRSGPIVNMTRCDSGATNYKFSNVNYAGSLTQETTIVRTGGATDGTTPVSYKIATTANSLWTMPFECTPIAIWNDVSGSSVTVTVYGIWGGGAVPNNDDIWIDVEYLGSSSTPQASYATSTKADNLATGSALTSDTSTWGGSTTKFKMTATFTPQQKGLLFVTVKAAKISTTFYIDPVINLS